MSTTAQIEANRQNALHSTGPQSETGKLSSSRNSFKHGFRSKFHLLAEEDPAEYETFLLSLIEEHQPSTIVEEVLVENMAQHHWLRDRALRYQHATLAYEHPDPKTMSLWMRYQTSNERAFLKCHTELQKIRAARHKEQIGFERQKQSEARAQREHASEQRKTELHVARVRLANASAAAKELETEVKAMIQAPLPGHATFDFEDLKGVMTASLRSLASSTMHSNK